MATSNSIDYLGVTKDWSGLSSSASSSSSSLPIQPMLQTLLQKDYSLEKFLQSHRSDQQLPLSYFHHSHSKRLYIFELSFRGEKNVSVFDSEAKSFPAVEAFSFPLYDVLPDTPLEFDGIIRVDNVFVVYERKKKELRSYSLSSLECVSSFEFKSLKISNADKTYLLTDDQRIYFAEEEKNVLHIFNKKLEHEGEWNIPGNLRLTSSTRICMGEMLYNNEKKLVIVLSAAVDYLDIKIFDIKSAALLGDVQLCYDAVVDVQISHGLLYCVTTSSVLLAFKFSHQEVVDDANQILPKNDFLALVGSHRADSDCHLMFASNSILLYHAKWCSLSSIPISENPPFFGVKLRPLGNIVSESHLQRLALVPISSTWESNWGCYFVENHSSSNKHVDQPLILMRSNHKYSLWSMNLQRTNNSSSHSSYQAYTVTWLQKEKRFPFLSGLIQQILYTGDWLIISTKEEVSGIYLPLNVVLSICSTKRVHSMFYSISLNALFVAVSGEGTKAYEFVENESKATTHSESKCPKQAKEISVYLCLDENEVKSYAPSLFYCLDDEKKEVKALDDKGGCILEYRKMNEKIQFIQKSRFGNGMGFIRHHDRNKITSDGWCYSMDAVSKNVELRTTKKKSVVLSIDIPCRNYINDIFLSGDEKQLYLLCGPEFLILRLSHQTSPFSSQWKSLYKSEILHNNSKHELQYPLYDSDDDD